MRICRKYTVFKKLSDGNEILSQKGVGRAGVRVGVGETSGS